MKTQYKLALLALGLATVTSCAKHDPLADAMEIGQPVPTCYWSVGSSACKAGDDFTFNGKYYTDDNHTPDHSEVWYLVKRDESASVTVKLAGRSLSYNKSIASTDTVRDNQSIVSFSHSEEYWNGYEYELNGSVPTSVTLSPVDWKNVSEWDQEKYDMYFPAGFAEEFMTEVIDYLTKDSTYYAGLRTVYINYNFTNEQFAAVNSKYNLQFPTDIKIDPSDPQSAATDKSDRWYETTENDPDKVTGWYYKDVDGNDNTVIYEVAKDVVTVDETGLRGTYNGKNCFPVYDSAPWVFCRYDDDAGAIVKAVRASYIPAFKELLALISFPDWIYDSSENQYTVVFSREYSLDAQFRVYDTVGNVGKASDIRNIKLN